MDGAAVDLAVEYTRQAMLMTLKLAVPVLAVGLSVGLMVSLMQAVTQIQEQTLSFIPKMLAVVMTIIFLLPTLLMWVIEYTEGMFEQISRGFGG